MKCPGEIGNVFYNNFSSSSQEQAAKEFTKLTLEEHNQSYYREVPRWEIFRVQELRFGLYLGRMANFSAFIASKSFDL